jgi:hypothetical protein
MAGMPARDPAIACAILRSRIAVLLNDPRVAERVRRRLSRPAKAAAVDLAGMPLCLRAAIPDPPALLRIKAGQCRVACGNIDCLCGAYPRSLTPEEVSHGPRLEPVAL